MEASGKGSSPSDVFRRIATLLATASAALVQCTSAPPPPPATSPPSVARPSPSFPAPPSASAPPAPAAATVHPVTAAELGATWRPGCPVEPGRLRRVEINYIGFDGQTHRGELIVHEDIVVEVVAIFEQLHRLRDFPSRRSARSTAIRPPTTSYPWKTTTPRRSTAETSPEPAGGLSTPTVEPSTSTRFSTRTSAARAHSNPRTPGHTWTAAALTRTPPRRRPGRARLHRSWLALGRLLANAHRPSALRAPLTLGHLPVAAARQSRSENTLFCNDIRDGDYQYALRRRAAIESPGRAVITDLSIMPFSTPHTLAMVRYSPVDVIAPAPAAVTPPAPSLSRPASRRVRNPSPLEHDGLSPGLICAICHLTPLLHGIAYVCFVNEIAIVVKLC